MRSISFRIFHLSHFCFFLLTGHQGRFFKQFTLKERLVYRTQVTEYTNSDFNPLVLLDLPAKVFDLNKDETVDKREFTAICALNDRINGVR